MTLIDLPCVIEAVILIICSLQSVGVVVVPLSETWQGVVIRERTANNR